MFKKIYEQIYPVNGNDKESEFLILLEESDPLNDGRVEPQGLKFALKKVLKGNGSISDEDIDRFVRFLDKDRAGKVDYMN